MHLYTVTIVRGGQIELRLAGGKAPGYRADIYDAVAMTTAEARIKAIDLHRATPEITDKSIRCVVVDQPVERGVSLAGQRDLTEADLERLETAHAADLYRVSV